MTGTKLLSELLKSLAPHMQTQDYAFCTVTGPIADYVALEPIAFVNEEEGLTLILPVSVAEREKLAFAGSFRKITLMVHSSLEAVGLTAAVSSTLGSHGIPANIIAGYYHDHVFVPCDKADAALQLLRELSQDN